MKELKELQCRFTSAKNLRNEFANFNYRNVEEMAKDLKPLLCELGCTVVFSDEIVNVGAYNYLKTTCTLTNSEGETVSNTAYAREDESRAGMCSPQLTGSASTYCRKYSLCGLLFVDSGDDPDSMDNRPAQATIPAPKTSVPKYTRDEEGLKQFVNDRWNDADKDGKHQLSAFYNENRTDSERLGRYSVEALWSWFQNDLKDGKKYVTQITPQGVDAKPIWVVRRSKK